MIKRSSYFRIHQHRKKDETTKAAKSTYNNIGKFHRQTPHSTAHSACLPAFPLTKAPKTRQNLRNALQFSFFVAPILLVSMTTSHTSLCMFRARVCVYFLPNASLLKFVALDHVALLEVFESFHLFEDNATTKKTKTWGGC